MDYKPGNVFFIYLEKFKNSLNEFDNQVLMFVTFNQ